MNHSKLWCLHTKLYPASKSPNSSSFPSGGSSFPPVRILFSADSSFRSLVALFSESTGCCGNRFDRALSSIAPCKLHTQTEKGERYSTLSTGRSAPPNPEKRKILLPNPDVITNYTINGHILTKNFSQWSSSLKYLSTCGRENLSGL